MVGSPRTSSRVLALCLDGTTNAFDTTNTNVAKLFQLLDKNDATKQLCYYQPGAGTYALPSIVTPITSAFTKVIDMAVAWFFDAHVTGAYKFIADNYQPGDKICIFGFSRGAYQARALAGMIEKVGLIPAHNDEQLAFAWNMYKGTNKASTELAKSFKGTFSRDVGVDFIGVWDTVASVGALVERHFPYTAKNKSIKIFRHAISLDERRCKFAQNRYHVNTAHVHDGWHDPEVASAPQMTDGSETPGEDDFEADVEEVYFAGAHTDVGGGKERNDATLALSNIPLEWMIQQIIKSEVGVRFNEAALSNWMALYKEASSPPSFLHQDAGTAGVKNNNGNSVSQSINGNNPIQINANLNPEIGDSLKVHKFSDIFMVSFWWILELLPFQRKYQDLADPKKKWKVTYWPNFGRPRVVAPGSKIHESVRQKMNMVPQSGGKKYVPSPDLPEDIEWVSF